MSSHLFPLRVEKTLAFQHNFDNRLLFSYIKYQFFEVVYLDYLVTILQSSRQYKNFSRHGMVAHKEHAAN